MHNQAIEQYKDTYPWSQFSIKHSNDQNLEPKILESKRVNFIVLISFSRAAEHTETYSPYLELMCWYKIQIFHCWVVAESAYNWLCSSELWTDDILRLHWNCATMQSTRIKKEQCRAYSYEYDKTNWWNRIQTVNI